MVDLKSCPFCGSANVSTSIGKTGDGRDWVYIECESCAAVAEPAAWNRRASDPLVAELVGALEAIEQRCNESGTGQMGLLDTIHAVAGIARALLAKVKGSAP